MNRISKAIALAWHDPKALLQIAYANSMARIMPVPSSCVEKKINGVRFEFDLRYGPQLRQMLFGAYEPLTITAMKKIIKPGDCFIDVGANIGFISAIAAGLVGKSGQVHCFEPSPRDFLRLIKFAQMNPGHKIFCHPYAVGAVNGTANLAISEKHWVGWNTLVPGFMDKRISGKPVASPSFGLIDFWQRRSTIRVKLR
jgi:hypothetical protein